METKAIIELSYDEVMSALTLIGDMNEVHGLLDKEEELYDKLFEVSVEMRRYVDHH